MTEFPYSAFIDEAIDFKLDTQLEYVKANGKMDVASQKWALKILGLLVLFNNCAMKLVISNSVFCLDLWTPSKVQQPEEKWVWLYTVSLTLINFVES